MIDNNKLRPSEDIADGLDLTFLNVGALEAHDDYSFPDFPEVCLCCLVLSCVVLSCLAVSCRVVSCLPLSSLVRSERAFLFKAPSLSSRSGVSLAWSTV